jgi:hypothetical protein
MEMVRHHTVSLKNPTALFTSLEKAFLEGLMRPLIDEQILTVVPTIDHVIHTIFPLDS